MTTTTTHHFARSLLLVALSATLSAAACSSSSSKGGSGGGGGTSTGGSDGAVTGTGGASGDAATSDAAGDGGLNLAELCPASPMRTMTSPAMTAATFCELYFQTCTGANNPADGGYTSQSECMVAYTALLSESTRECRSDHVCNAAVYFTGAVPLHCGHAAGNPPCADVVPDASTGN